MSLIVLITWKTQAVQFSKTQKDNNYLQATLQENVIPRSELAISLFSTERFNLTWHFCPMNPRRHGGALQRNLMSG
jgi:hypothetical protein